MYLTAQRVRGHRGQGINTFLHEGAIAADVDWTDFDQGRVQIGDLVRQRSVVPPGGNSVLSYLDMVSAGTIAPADVRGLLGTAPTVTTERGRVWVLGHVGARFALCGGVAHQPDPDDELEALVDHAIDVLHEESVAEPLEVQRRVSADGMIFELAPTALERLRRRHGPDWRPPRLSVRHDVLAQWRAAGIAAVQDEVVRILTGLTEEETEAEGGVRTVTVAE